MLYLTTSLPLPASRVISKPNTAVHSNNDATLK